MTNKWKLEVTDDKIIFVPGAYKKVSFNITAEGASPQNRKALLTLVPGPNLKTQKESYEINTASARIVTTYIGISCFKKPTEQTEIPVAFAVSEEAKEYFEIKSFSVTILQDGMNTYQYFVSSTTLFKNQFGLLTFISSPIYFKNVDEIKITVTSDKAIKFDETTITIPPMQNEDVYEFEQIEFSPADVEEKFTITLSNENKCYSPLYDNISVEVKTITPPTFEEKSIVIEELPGSARTNSFIFGARTEMTDILLSCVVLTSDQSMPKEEQILAPTPGYNKKTTRFFKNYIDSESNLIAMQPITLLSMIPGRYNLKCLIQDSSTNNKDIRITKALEMTLHYNNPLRIQCINVGASKLIESTTKQQ